MAEGSNDTDIEHSTELSAQNKATPSPIPAKAASITENNTAQEERLKKVSNGLGSSTYLALIVICGLSITTMGNYTGLQGSLREGFTYTVAAGSTLNPMQYLSSMQVDNQTSSVPATSTSSSESTEASRPSRPSNHSAAICVMQKQTVEYFEEWMLYHKALGFDKIYVYDNQEDNEFERWLKTQSKEIKDMVGNYTVWPGTKQQVKGYLDCWNKIRDAKSHEWIAFIDVDEFVVIKDLEKFPTIMDLLDSLPEYQYGLTINWVMFHLNKQMKKEDKPVTFRFQNYTSNLNISIPGTVKSMVRAQVKPKMKNPHFIKYKVTKSKYAYMSRDSRGNVVYNFENPHKEVRDVALYHYLTKSLEEYKARCARGDVLRNPNDWPDMLFCKSDEEILDHFVKEEDIHDDRPWQFLQERVPEYTKRYTNTT